MSALRLIVVSLLHHWRVNLAVACGAAAGTAVLTGALLVGDSMRGSLRDLTLDRLGRIEHALVSEQFFRADLADELAAQPEFREHFAAAVPAIVLRGSMKTQSSGGSEPVRVGGVNVIACDERFWRLGSGGPTEMPESRRRVVLNRPLAERLGIAAGADGTGAPPEDMRVMLHLPNLGTIPTGTLLGDKSDTVEGHRLTVSEVIPAEGLGRFTLRPSQQKPLNAYVSLELGARLFRREIGRRPGRVNAILVAAGDDARRKPSPGGRKVLQRLLRPKLEDYGIRVEVAGGAEESGSGSTPPPARRYFNVTTERMLFDPVADRVLAEALADRDAQAALTYLANTIAVGDRQLAYSTVAAVDFVGEPPLGPFRTPEGRPIEPLEDEEIVLNDWTAADLEAQPGDTVRLSYFEPESTHGRMRERTAAFTLAAVARLAGPADDPAFTPEVPGVTDEESISDWDPPFRPFERDRIRPPRKDPKYPEDEQDRDEQYWEKYRTTPKAFVSLAAGRKLWGSRFGRTSSWRVPPKEGAGGFSDAELDRQREQLEATLEKALAPQAGALGFMFRPVKKQGLEASKGATSFSSLFLGFSFFIIAAAVMLVALLFRLGIDGRANEVGILLAVGLGRRKVARILAGEGLAVAASGGLAGVAVGLGYAALMLAGLTSEHWWLAAVGTPFLRLHTESTFLGIEAPWSLLWGYLAGVAVALGAILWAVWRTRGAPARRLLAGQIGSAAARGTRGRFGRWVGGALLLAALVFGLLAARVGDEMQAGAFFGAGAMVLAASLTLAWSRLRAGTLRSVVAVGRGNLTRMALRSLARNPGRSTLTIGLVAAASFLIVSVSAFRMDPTGQTPRRDSGNGGFALVAETDQPVFYDLNAPTGRAELGFSPEESRLLERADAYALRVRSGDDATCLNLYRPRDPRVLGVPERLIERDGFEVVPWVEPSEAEAENPWRLLERDPGRGDDGVARVPAFADASTATYLLHLSKRNPSLDVRNRRGETVRLVVVGVLPRSIFQGDLLVSEPALLDHFPETSGYRFFLIETPPDATRAVQRALGAALGDYGLVSETTGERLARFLAVQNTYLGTFQSLGGLGLLLGTFGLAAVQLRSVLERRGELALLRAIGFRRRALARMVMLENGLLLVTGLACGVAAALVAVLPHLASGRAAIPWGSLAGTLLLVLAVGLVAGLGAVRAVLAAPLLAALRGE